MKQGRSSRDVNESSKVEPRPHAISPGAVSRLGTLVGTGADYLPMNAGRGYSPPQGPTSSNIQGPGAGRTIYPNGVQGKRK